jgi:hypothetical protein
LRPKKAKEKQKAAARSITKGDEIQADREKGQVGLDWILFGRKGCMSDENTFGVVQHVAVEVAVCGPVIAPLEVATSHDVVTKVWAPTCRGRIPNLLRESLRREIKETISSPTSACAWLHAGKRRGFCWCVGRLQG